MRLPTLLMMLVCTCTLAAACGGDVAKRAVPPASEGVRAFIAVLRSSDPEPAYALLSAELRQTMSFEEFATAWKQSAPERAAQARSLEEELQNPVALGEQAALVYEDGKTVYLAREDASWRIESPVVSQRHAARPHDAVIFFAQALAARDFDTLLSLLTDRRREGISAQFDAFVTSLEERLASPNNEVELIGDDRAEMRWDDGRKRYKLILRKEGDEWRIDDIQLQPTPVAPGEE